MGDVYVRLSETALDEGASKIFEMLGVGDGCHATYDEVALEVFKTILAHCRTADGHSVMLALETK